MTSYRKFEDVINAYWEERGTSAAQRAYWGADGLPLLEIPLLEALLTRSVRDGDSTQSGGLAKALDMWVAEELRAAGFDGQAVWPRLSKPRVLDPAVLRFIGSLDPCTVEACRAALPAFAGSAANVLGSTYTKQIDVGLSSWMTGPEILVSTKTMGSSFGKNLSNRFEEAYGDAKNLKGRHPMATLGFFFLVNAAIADEPRIFAKAVTMLEKLRMESDAYDATCLLLVDWDASGNVAVSAENERLPESLSAPAFFSDIVALTLLRAAPDSHEAARMKRAGLLPESR